MCCPFFTRICWLRLVEPEPPKTTWPCHWLDSSNYNHEGTFYCCNPFWWSCQTTEFPPPPHSSEASTDLLSVAEACHIRQDGDLQDPLRGTISRRKSSGLLGDNRVLILLAPKPRGLPKIEPLVSKNVAIGSNMPNFLVERGNFLENHLGK